MIPLALRSCETASERHAGDELKRPRRRDAADRSEPVPLHQVPLRVVREVGDRGIRQAPEVHGVVHGRELDRVQRVEDVEPNLELRAAARCRSSSQIDRSRLLSGGSRAKNRGVSSPLLPGCGGAKHDGLANCLYGSPLHPRPGSQVRAMRAFGLPSVPGQVPGADAGNREVDGVGAAARPSVDARDLPVVDQESQRSARRRDRCLVDGVDREVVRPVVVHQRVVEAPGLFLAQIRHTAAD